MKIKFSGVSKEFTSVSEEPRRVLQNISFEKRDSKIVAIVGANGSGKSTFLNLLSGLDSPSSGTIEVGNNSQSDTTIGQVWQDYRSSLLPWLSGLENISLPLRLRGIENRVRTQKAKDLLNKFSVGLRIDATQPVSTLSGGQQQLLCLLRCLMGRPDLILLDEPTSALDQKTSWDIGFHLENYWLQHRVPLFLVSHDIDQAILLSCEIWLLSAKSGTIIEKIPNETSRPRSDQTLQSTEHLKIRRRVLDFLLTNEQE